MAASRPVPLTLLLSLVFFSACGVVERLGVNVLAKRAVLPDAQVQRNVSYGVGRALDVYRATTPNAPVLVFVYGGGWNTGSKDLRVGGLDVYGNIGRFYASQGVTTVVINYRLQPAVRWREQAADVAAAVKWTKQNIATFGGNPERIFLMGHSAGAHLASMVSLNQGIQTTAGIGRCDIDGVVSVSGAGLDLDDQETYRTEDPGYYEQRFGPRTDRAEWTAASPATHADAADAAVLILYATGESRGLQRQSRVFKAALDRASVPAQLLAIKGESHTRMVLVLSHPEKAAVPAVLDFLRNTRCPRQPL